MNTKHIFKAGLFSLLAVTAACTAEDPWTGSANEAAGGEGRQVVMNVNKFVVDGGETRNTVEVTPDAVNFAWSTGDKVGVCPADGSEQVKFVIPAEFNGQASATFDGGGWWLKAKSTYAAYYPFIEKFGLDQTNIPVDFAGQAQTGANTNHLGKYDFIAAKATTPANGSANFDFKHMGSLMVLNLTFPKATTVNNVTLTANDWVFTTAGAINLKADPIAINPSSAKAKTLSMNVSEVSTTGDNETVTLYMMVIPVNLVSKEVTVSVGDYSAVLEQKNLEAGKAYVYNVTFEALVDPYDKTMASDDSKYPVDNRVTSASDKNIYSTTRLVNKISMTTNINGQSRSFSKDIDRSKRYLNHKETVFEAQAGQQVTCTIGYEGEWMFGHVFIDFGKDGFTGGKKGNRGSSNDFFKPTGDLMSYSGYEEKISENLKYYYSSASNSITGEGKAINPPAFTIPADTPAGVYRMRWTIDWNGVSAPAGNFTGQDFIGNQGTIIDVLLKVTPAQ